MRGQRRHLCGLGRLGNALNAGPVQCFRLFAQHIFGQGNDDRAGAPRHRHSKGAGNIFGDARRLINPHGPFGKRREHGGKINFLKPFAILHSPIYIANEQDHWLGILHRNMHANRGIGRPRPARHKGNARPPGQRTIRARHESDTTFLTADDILDLWPVMQRIEHREKTLARHGEQAINALDHKLVHQNLATSAQLGLGHSLSLGESWQGEKAQASGRVQIQPRQRRATKGGISDQGSERKIKPRRMLSAKAPVAACLPVRLIIPFSRHARREAP